MSINQIKRNSENRTLYVVLKTVLVRETEVVNQAVGRAETVCAILYCLVIAMYAQEKYIMSFVLIVIATVSFHSLFFL